MESSIRLTPWDEKTRSAGLTHLASSHLIKECLRNPRDATKMLHRYRSPLRCHSACQIELLHRRSLAFWFTLFVYDSSDEKNFSLEFFCDAENVSLPKPLSTSRIPRMAFYSWSHHEAFTHYTEHRLPCFNWQTSRARLILLLTRLFLSLDALSFISFSSFKEKRIFTFVQLLRNTTIHSNFFLVFLSALWRWHKNISCSQCFKRLDEVSHKTSWRTFCCSYLLLSTHNGRHHRTEMRGEQEKSFSFN